jgi:hypothetical protein
LGPEGRPRNHYDLLGLTPETATVERVRAAVQELFTRIRKYETSEKPGVQERVTQLRAEIAAADLCLANPNKKQEYDQAQFGRTFDLLPDAPPETVTKAAATRETVAEPQGAGAKTVQPTVVDDAATTVADATLPDATVAIVKEMEKKGAEEAVVSQPVQEETPAGSSPSAAPEVIEVEVVPEEEPRGQSVLARAFGGAVWLLLPFRQVDRLLTAIVGQENDILRWFLRIAVGAAASGAIAYFGVLPLLRLSRSASEAPTPVAKSGSGVDRGPEEDPELADDGEMTDEELASWAIEVWEAASLEAKEPSGVTWIDATREPWKCGDVTVKVRAAAISRARLVDAAKRVADTQEDFLLLLVEIANNSPTRKIQYTGWSLRGEQPRLTDDLKNAYTMQVAPGGGFFEGQQRIKSLYPEKTAEDLLVFERPVDKARSLRLQLPAGAFEGTGTGYIEIPMSMVKSDLGPAFKRAVEPVPPETKKAGANGEAKEADKGAKGEEKKETPAGKPAATGANHDTAAPERTGMPATGFGIKAEDAPSPPSLPKPVRGPPPAPPLKKKG